MSRCRHAPYKVVPSPTIDFRVHDGVRDIPIEERSGDEVLQISGLTRGGRAETIAIAAAGTPVANYAFDMTPARLVSGLITERGVIPANRQAIASAFPERVSG
jgi:methylthioribose-1-phosphate isomerase